MTVYTNRGLNNCSCRLDAININISEMNNFNLEIPRAMVIFDNEANSAIVGGMCNFQILSFCIA